MNEMVNKETQGTIKDLTIRNQVERLGERVIEYTPEIPAVEVLQKAAKLLNRLSTETRVFPISTAEEYNVKKLTVEVAPVNEWKGNATDYINMTFDIELKNKDQIINVKTRIMLVDCSRILKTEEADLFNVEITLEDSDLVLYYNGKMDSPLLMYRFLKFIRDYVND